MSIFHFGELLRQRRLALGCSQEELCDGICAPATLSRIENGERMPLQEHLEMLLQRLGYSETMAYAYVDKNTLLKHELKFNIRQAVILKQFDTAKQLLERFEEQFTELTPLDQQFLLLQKILVKPDYAADETLERLETAIRLTCPSYDKLPRVLSYEEILLLNSISVCYRERKDYDRAIRILMHIKHYYESHIVNMEEVLRTQPLILFSLSKCLGWAGRFEECIEICDQAIQIAQQTGRCPMMAMTLYNRACAFWELGDKEEARKTVLQAYRFAEIMQQTSSVEHYRRFIEKNFPGENLL